MEFKPYKVEEDSNCDLCGLCGRGERFFLVKYSPEGKVIDSFDDAQAAQKRADTLNDAFALGRAFAKDNTNNRLKAIASRYGALVREGRTMDEFLSDIAKSVREEHL